MSPVLEMENVTVTALQNPANVVLDEVNWTVRAGDFWAVAGLHRSGKSDLLALAAGLMPPARGVCRVFGHDAAGPVRDEPAASPHRRLGLVFDGGQLLHHLTVAENIALPLRYHRNLSMPEAAARAQALLELTGLQAWAGQLPAAISRNWQQRAGLARALALPPEVLLLDSPLTGLDPLQRRKTIRLIKDWARAGKHIIVSSHILHEIESMTSNILLINNGRILAEGNVHQIRDLIDTHPHTVFVRGEDPRALARRFMAEDDVLSMKFEPGAVIVETSKPDSFYARLTELAASGEAGRIDEVQSPDDNLQAVFKYLVKQ